MAGISLLKLDETTRDEVVAQTAELLLAGGIVIFPTDTVYGLMAHSTDAAELARLNALKNRPFNKSIAALAAAEAALIAHMRKLVCSLPGASGLIPGALTVIAERDAWQDTLPDPLLSLPYSRIGVRIPKHPALQDVIVRCGGWLMATSANLEGLPTPTSVAEIVAQFESAEDVELAADGGRCRIEPSAVVEIVGGQARILRPHPLLGR